MYDQYKLNDSLKPKNNRKSRGSSSKKPFFYNKTLNKYIFNNLLDIICNNNLEDIKYHHIFRLWD